LTATGRCSDAGGKIEGVVASARALGYPPLTAESLLAQALLAEKLGAIETTTKTCEAAVWEALKGRRDDVAADAASLLISYEGYYQAHYENAQRWYELARALLERLGPGHERAAAWLAQGHATLFLRQGRLREALAECEVALALKQRVLPADHPDVAITWASMGDARARLGDAAGALDAADRALGIYRRAYGRDNPLVAFPLGNRGEAFGLLGRHAEAERDLREAIAKWVEQVGPDHPFVSYPLTALGKTLIATGRGHEAVAVLERALRIREADRQNEEPLAETRFALARALVADRADAIRSRALAVAARDSYRGMTGHGGDVTAIDRWLIDRR
jgi:serine/threonine-protein kinase